MGDHGPSKSNLAHDRYNLDMVVATTQQAINGTMMGILSEIAEMDTVKTALTSMMIREKAVPPAKTGELVAKDWDVFNKQWNVDPFNEDLFPNETSIPLQSDEPHFTALASSRLVYAVKIKFGLPAGKNIPPILLLNDASTAVDYNMMCAEITFITITTELDEDNVPYKLLRRYSQQPGAPWVFKTTVNLRLAMADRTERPDAINAKIKQLGLGREDYSVERLIVELDNAAQVQTAPQMQKVFGPGSKVAPMVEFFNDTYWQVMKRSGRTPTLGYQIVRQSATQSRAASLIPTTLDMRVSLPVDSAGGKIMGPQLDAELRGSSTLCYASMVNNRNMTPGDSFGWNWVPSSVADKYHGCISISRTAFARWFSEKLYDNVAKQTYKPECEWKIFATGDLAPGMTYGTSRTTTPDKNKWSFPTSGSEIARYSWEEFSESSITRLGFGYYMRVTYTFWLSVTVSGSTVTVKQHCRYNLHMKVKSTDVQQDIVKWDGTEVHEIGVALGKITSKQVSNDTPPAVETPLKVGWIDNLFTGINSDADFLLGQFKDRTASIKPIDLSDLTDFVFPGGNTFAFKTAGFSEFGDLIAYITYLEPTAERFLNGTWLSR